MLWKKMVVVLWLMNWITRMRKCQWKKKPVPGSINFSRKIDFFVGEHNIDTLGASLGTLENVHWSSFDEIITNLL